MSVRLMGQLRRSISDLIYPPAARCPGCGDLCGCDGWMCDECLKSLTPAEDSFFLVSGGGARYEACAAFMYEGALINAIYSFKYRGIKDLSLALGEELAAAIERNDMVPDLIVPVPLHRSRQRKRGFNQSEALAKVASDKLKIPCRNLVARVKRTEQQARLDHGRRTENVAGAFSVIGPVAGRRVLVIDDVITTGSTVSECCRVLAAAGAAKVSAAALADAFTHNKRT